MDGRRESDIVRAVMSLLAPLVAVLMAASSIGIPVGSLPPAPGAGPDVRSIQRMDWFESSWKVEDSALDARMLFLSPDPSEVPPLPPDSGSGKRIVYSNGDQRVWLVDAQERVVDSYLISGRRGVPGPGTYEVFSKSPWTTAIHDGITMRWMVRFTRTKITNIGFHDIPTYPNGRPMQTDAEFGTYRSGGCVRQPNDKAKRLYQWAPVGTTVVVTP
jgi:lipoprotein-anchoring transpeptidase ErfK/SrfK